MQTQTLFHYKTYEGEIMKQKPIKTNHKLIRLFLAGLTLIAIGMTTANAGQDGKTVPGTYCKAFGVNDPDIKYSSSGFIYNASYTKSRTIICPIIRDMMGRYSKWNKIVISYSNPHPAQRISCTVYVRSPYDDRTISYHRNYSGTNRINLMRLYNSTKSGTGLFTLSCTLPPRPGPGQGVPGISMIKVLESD